MNKLVAVLGIVIILLSSVCGVLYYQISDMQSQIGDLENQNNVLEGQVSEYQNQTGQLENQINELESQLGDLENQNVNLQNQTRELENKLDLVLEAGLVHITDFIINETNLSATSMGFSSKFFVTVENFGNNDVKELKLILNIQYHNETSNRVSNASIILGTVNAGESRTVGATHYYGSERTFVVNLMIDDMIIDRRVITIII